MFDQSYGLRFDIYERIHLSEDVSGIAELEEIELLPHIQVISQGEQVALRGHLLLNGLYRGDGEEDETQRLEHFIPVEITVPSNRVSSLDEIAVEIENFDVDLLSQRSLNITGVLSLRGIETAVSESAGAWNADEFTVVHASDDPAEDPVLAAFLEEEEERADAAEIRETNEAPAAEYSETPAYITETSPPEPAELFGSDEVRPQHPSPQEPSFQERADSEPQEPEEVFAPSALHTDKESVERSGNKTASNVWHFEHEDEAELLHPENSAIAANEEEDQETDIYLTSIDQEPAFPFSAFHQETVHQEEGADERELRIGLSSKKETQADPKGAIGFSSLLTSSRSLKEQEQLAVSEEPQKEEAEREAAGNDDIQWQNLFLGSSSEKNQFRKVRLCIVQREETLETIASRYQLSAREILLYNRLAEQTIEEGQILYIP
ncbi:LysM peptidoglycan-binding domain-containing protein [Paenibacillus chibensis]|uniref:LysM peptidoglycan-binding domain-containing protein n=1 Tax=Paenibacillus chibensis TaxID=59846 RepID=UPI000FD7DF16|nr:LysM peptidoglycan-binding domain-containing protein [Paenibacillus chibensis]MEC0372338.1 LysM peptidoglycan-binding domain-containing protein [Paenibacillus chibensis]